MSKKLQEKYDQAMTLLDSLAEDDCPCDNEDCVHKEARQMVQIYELERMQTLSVPELVRLLSTEALSGTARVVMAALENKMNKRRLPLIVEMTHRDHIFRAVYNRPYGRELVFRYLLPETPDNSGSWEGVADFEGNPVRRIGHRFFAEETIECSTPGQPAHMGKTYNE